jgi:hypothetical protein
MAVYISRRQGCRVKRAIGRIALIAQVRGVWVYEIADLTNIRKTEVEQIDAGAAIGRLASAPSEEGIAVLFIVGPGRVPFALAGVL